MTYQSTFLNDKYATMSASIGLKYKKSATWMHETAKILIEADKKYFETKEKYMSDDHLRQTLVKLAKT